MTDPDDLLDRRVCLRISHDALVRMLDLPQGTRIRGIHSSFDPIGIDIAVVHPDLPLVPPEACAPITGSPTVSRERFATIDGRVWFRSSASWAELEGLS